MVNSDAGSGDECSSSGSLDDFLSFSPAAPPPEKKKKRKRDVDALIAASHTSAHSLEESYAAREPAPAPAPAAASSPKAVAPAHVTAHALNETVASLQADLAADFPAWHKKPRDAIDARAAARGRHGKAAIHPKASKDGKVRTFNEKEKRSRSKRGDNDYVQEEKRILRQCTDGYSMGY